MQTTLITLIQVTCTISRTVSTSTCQRLWIIVGAIWRYKTSWQLWRTMPQEFQKKAAAKYWPPVPIARYSFILLGTVGQGTFSSLLASFMQTSSWKQSTTCGKTNCTKRWLSMSTRATQERCSKHLTHRKRYTLCQHRARQALHGGTTALRSTGSKVLKCEHVWETSSRVPGWRTPRPTIQVRRLLRRNFNTWKPKIALRRSPSMEIWA